MLIASRSIFAIIIALTCCIQQQASAKPQHVITMQTPTQLIEESRSQVNFTDNQIKNFFSKVERNEAGCWIWIAGRSTTGYGKFNLSGRAVGSHIVSRMIFSGAIPKGMNVCHKCDNPLCVNPDHLFTGTQQDNLNDMVSKGRASSGEAHGKIMLLSAARGDSHGSVTKPNSRATGNRHGSKTHPEKVVSGESQHLAKLNDEIVREIRFRSSLGESGLTLAKAFGVSRSNISIIVNRKAWKHVA